VRWSGRGDDGGAVPPGVYWLRLAAHAAGARVTRAIRLIVLP
jgi:hypothetical protein